MQIAIDLHLIVNGTRTMKSAVFPIRRVADIPKTAHEWVRATRRETGYPSTIEKVIYNGDVDITEEVKKIDEAPIPDLPYLW